MSCDMRLWHFIHLLQMSEFISWLMSNDTLTPITSGLFQYLVFYSGITQGRPMNQRNLQQDERKPKSINSYWTTLI